MGPSSLTDLDASGEWGRGRKRAFPNPEPSTCQAIRREGKECSEVLAWVGVRWGSSKYSWAWTSARSCVGELGYAVLDGREVWEASMVEAAAVAATALGVLQEAGRTREEHVVSQHSGTSWHQSMSFQQLQVSQVPSGPVCQKHQICPTQLVLGS